MREISATTKRILLAAIVIFLAGPVGQQALARNQTREFLEHLERVMPTAMSDAGVSGATVAIIANGEIAAVRGFGRISPAVEAEKVRPDTVFNAGSISKLVTAWAVMQLVNSEQLDLDEPVTTYLGNWKPVSRDFDANKITTRMLLSHTSGLSMSAVPEFGPDDDLPALQDAINNLTIENEPGDSYNYSGGGYMVLQHLIKKISGESFDEFMRRKILTPLGMRNSAFGWNDMLLENAAQPLDGPDGRRVPYFRYTGEAAASLNTTATDLARLLVAELAPDRQSVLTPDLVREMLSVQPGTEQPYGIRDSLGHGRWNLADGGFIFGHNGQNTGWGATAWIAPHLNSGIVVLTNNSDGRQTWKWVLCDWAKWQADTTWYGMCTGRPEYLTELPEELVGSPQEVGVVPMEVPKITQEIKKHAGQDFAGLVAVVGKGDDTIHAKAYGLADIETNRKVEISTAFYLASVTKPITATAILQLVEQRKLSLDKPIASYGLELPDKMGRVTIRQLLSHTSGVPDYWQYFDFRKSTGLNNDRVIEILHEHPGIEFEPGSRYAYSNSGFVLLARLIEISSGMSYHDYLEERIFAPSGMHTAEVYDQIGRNLPERAFGYTGEKVSMDYVAFRYADGSTTPVGLTTTGSGGIFASALDLQKFARGLLSGDLVSPDMLKLMFTPRIMFEDEGDKSHGRFAYALGWEVGSDGAHEVFSHNGGMVGFSNLMLIVPEREIFVTVLSNHQDTDADAIAFRIFRALE